MHDATSKASLKERAAEELKAYLIIALYLYVLFGAFIAYRRLISAEMGSPYLHYGMALIEALIIGKVILIGNLFGSSRRYEDRALAVSVLYKSVFFAVLVVLFEIVERLIEGWLHKENLATIFSNIASIGRNELLARLIIMFVTFVPLFAFLEIGRVLGPRKLGAMFFAKGGGQAAP